MLIQLQPQHLTVLKLKLELFPVEPRIVPMDNPVVVWADDNDIDLWSSSFTTRQSSNKFDSALAALEVRRVVVLRMGEIVDVARTQQRPVHCFLHDKSTVVVHIISVFVLLLLSSYTIDLRSSLLSLGIIGTSSILLSLNRSLLHDKSTVVVHIITLCPFCCSPRTPFAVPLLVAGPSGARGPSRRQSYRWQRPWADGSLA